MQSPNFARAAYERYYQSVGGLSVYGEPLHTWDELLISKPDIASAWGSAADAVTRCTIEWYRDLLSSHLIQMPR